MVFKRNKWELHKDYVESRLSVLWCGVKSQSDSVQITIEKAEGKDDIYRITLDYLIKEQERCK